MAIYHLNHRAVGKKSSAPGTAAAKVRYMTRAKACERVVTVGLSTHPKALERAANENEQNSRANARVCDTFHIALPIEMNAEQRTATTRSFLWALTEHGKAKAFAAFHGGDTHNPHIHVMFFDRDSEGKRVQGMSERGSTERMRLLWENVCNAKLEEYGFDIRIDRRTLEAQQQLEPESPDTPLEAENEHETVAPKERRMSKLEEEYLAGLSDEERQLLQQAYMEREEYVSAAQRIEDALEYDTEYQRLKAIQAEIADLEAQAESAHAEADRLHELAAEANRQEMNAFNDRLAAEDTFETHKHSSGRLRGFELFGFKTPARRRAHEARHALEAKTSVHAYRQKDAAYANLSHQIEKGRAEMLALAKEAESLALANHLHVAYGPEATLKSAEYLQVKSVSVALEGLTPSDIYAAYENGEIDKEQAIRAFELTGDLEMINAVEQRDRREEGLEAERAANDNGLEV